MKFEKVIEKFKFYNSNICSDDVKYLSDNEIILLSCFYDVDLISPDFIDDKPYMLTDFFNTIKLADYMSYYIKHPDYIYRYTVIVYSDELLFQSFVYKQIVKLYDINCLNFEHMKILIKNDSFGTFKRINADKYGSRILAQNLYIDHFYFIVGIDKICDLVSKYNKRVLDCLISAMLQNFEHDHVRQCLDTINNSVKTNLFDLVVISTVGKNEYRRMKFLLRFFDKKEFNEKFVPSYCPIKKDKLLKLIDMGMDKNKLIQLANAGSKYAYLMSDKIYVKHSKLVKNSTMHGKTLPYDELLASYFVDNMNAFWLYYRAARHIGIHTKMQEWDNFAFNVYPELCNVTNFNKLEFVTLCSTIDNRKIIEQITIKETESYLKNDDTFGSILYQLLYHDSKFAPVIAPHLHRYRKDEYAKKIDGLINFINKQ